MEARNSQVALAVSGGVAVASSLYMYYQYRKSLEAHKGMEEAYWGERRGRTRVEQEMKRLAEVQLNTSEGFFVQVSARYVLI